MIFIIIFLGILVGSVLTRNGMKEYSKTLCDSNCKCIEVQKVRDDFDTDVWESDTYKKQ